ncbi:MAG: FAD-binding protein [Pseudomonadota bacterium]
MRPVDEADLAHAISSADGPLRITGGGTRTLVHVAGTPLDTSGLTGMELYEPGAMTLVVRAGTPLAEVEALLATENQRLAFEPPNFAPVLGRPGQSTIGGVVAANASGPRRLQAGACRDAMLGVRFVDGAGTIIKNGGRVMKNVTGYDLVKLLSGSNGTLGVLSEVSLKVLPTPEAEATLIFEGQTVSAAVDTLCDAMGTPFDVTGAAYVAAGKKTAIRVEGLSASVTYRQAELQRGVAAGFEVLEGASSAALWADIRDLAPFVGRTGDLWRASMKPTDAPGLIGALDDAGIGHDAILDWSGGLVSLLVTDGRRAGGELIRAHVAACGGHATCLRGDHRAYPPQSPGVARLEAGLRARFDPRGILNPGLMEA